jgi:hypothetical protein
VRRRARSAVFRGRPLQKAPLATTQCSPGLARESHERQLEKFVVLVSHLSLRVWRSCVFARNIGVRLALLL